MRGCDAATGPQRAAHAAPPPPAVNGNVKAWPLRKASAEEALEIAHKLRSETGAVMGKRIRQTHVSSNPSVQGMWMPGKVIPRPVIVDGPAAPAASAAGKEA